MKKNTKRYIKLSLILYIVILSVALVSTLAWFVYEKSATISTAEDSKIVAGEYLEICYDDNDDSTEDMWSSELVPVNLAQFPDVSITPEGKIWYPISLDENDNLLVGNQGEGVYLDVTGTPDRYCVKLDLKVRASQGMKVYLDSSSFVSGVDTTKTDVLGMYSKDLIAGASRVAFFAEDGTKMLWIPNDTYELKIDESTGDIIGFDTDGASENSYKYLNVITSANNKTMLEEGNEYGTWTSQNANIVCGNDTLASGEYNNDAKPILTFSQEGVKKLTVYIWIEGTDREANTKFSGGSLKYNIKFTGIATKVASKVNIDDVVYDSGRLIYESSGASVGSEIIYSYDNKVWTPYSDGNPDLKGEHTVLYVRAKETLTENAGKVKEIPLQ